MSFLLVFTITFQNNIFGYYCGQKCSLTPLIEHLWDVIHIHNQLLRGIRCYSKTSGFLAVCNITAMLVCLCWENDSHWWWPGRVVSRLRLGPLLSPHRLSHTQNQAETYPLLSPHRLAHARFPGCHLTVHRLAHTLFPGEDFMLISHASHSHLNHPLDN